MNLDEPESLVIFAQESGRAGRDGKRAYSMLLLPATWQPRVADGPSDELCGTDNYRSDLSFRKRHDKEAHPRGTCGLLRYTLNFPESPDDARTTLRHCQSCKRAFGGAFGLWSFKMKKVEVVVQKTSPKGTNSPVFDRRRAPVIASLVLIYMPLTLRRCCAKLRLDDKFCFARR